MDVILNLYSTITVYSINITNVSIHFLDNMALLNKKIARPIVLKFSNIRETRAFYCISIKTGVRRESIIYLKINVSRGLLRVQLKSFPLVT